MDLDRIKEIEKNLFEWFVKNQYKGHDPYQLDQKASGLIKKFPFLKHLRKLLKPLHVFIPKSTFTSFPAIYHPKALGLIIGGNAFLYHATGEKKYIESSQVILELLKDLRNKSYTHYAWGSPFEWGSNPRYPVNTPAVCLVSPIGNSLLDYYEVVLDPEVLEICKSIALHIVNENGFNVVSNESICLNYSPIDKHEVYNSNALAAKLLFRLNKHTENSEHLEFAKKICHFVINSQLPNGAWVYSKTSEVIDNRHTGFILESLAAIRTFWVNEQLELAFKKGLNFYTNELMESELPRWSLKKTYPIDIHDVAQSIITFTESADFPKAKQIANFAIDNMSNQRDEFYFKYFKNGTVNKNVFIRWGQAWMYYALGKMMYHANKNS